MLNPGDVAQLESITVSAKLKLTEGAVILPGLVVGRPLSRGIQGRVSLLVDDNGAATDWLVKVMFLRNSFDDMEREWIIGRTINLLGNSTFMTTGPALRAEGSGIFLGMLIRRIHGLTCDKIVMYRKFHDIHWIQKCLFQTLAALDEAQKCLGFHHYDLRLGNIMVEGETEEDCRDVNKATFKIIDFGLGAFDEAYALIPNGREAVKALLEALALKRPVVLPPERSGGSVYKGLKRPIAATTASILAVLKSPSLPFSRTGSNNKTPAINGVEDVSDDIRSAAEKSHKSGTKDRGDSMSSGGPESGIDGVAPLDTTQLGDSAGVVAEEVLDSDPKPLPARYISRALGEVTRLNWSALPFARGDPIPQWLTSSIFKKYRQFWEHKSDLLYLAFSLVHHLDRRIWPKSDERPVRLLMSFLHHVTGCQLRYSLREDMSDLDATRKRRRLRYRFRAFCLKMKTFYRPYNSGITAAEALCAPFFYDCPGNNYGGHMPADPREETVVI